MACRLIEAAKEAGADAVKFQLFSADRLVAASTPSCAYQRSHNNGTEHQHAMLKGLELPPSAFVELKRHADRLGIDFLATPFGLPELNFLVDELDVPALKIASSDVVNVPLLTAASESGRPLIVSTGASLLQEIDQAVELIRCGGGLERLVLLHCVSSYPTRFENARLGCVGTLRERFGVAVGFSDHTVEETTGALAVMAGAVVLEKHLTLNREAQGPDHFFSLEPPMFKDYVFGIRQAATVLSDGEMGYSSEEAEVRKLARGRVVTTKPIVAGQRLTADALMVQRPGNGIPPVHWRDLIGRIARIDIPSDTPLAWSMIVSTQ
ncbi:MAG: N-acetylneuraminate synthase family protein [Phycisphaerales bacterium]|nr:N-acetylneuraminate synthase family protein [Phycisphaerales bacterium]